MRQVIAAVGHDALDIAEPVWRELVERSIAYEFQIWDKTR